MTRPAFFDTNILVYAFLASGPRGNSSRSLVLEGSLISVQVLNEFLAVGLGKLKLDWAALSEPLALLDQLFPEPLPLDAHVHRLARRIAERYGIHIYDASIVASAVRSGCTTLYTEDLQDGQSFESALTVRNPFATTPP